MPAYCKKPGRARATADRLSDASVFDSSIREDPSLHPSNHLAEEAGSSRSSIARTAVRFFAEPKARSVASHAEGSLELVDDGHRAE